MNSQPNEIQTHLASLPMHLAERAWLSANGKPGPPGERVLYWTHHALRSDENPALDVAVHLAEKLKLPLLVYQGLSEKYRFASDRHHTFILEAARDLEESYAKLGIQYSLHLDRIGARFPRLARLANSSAVVVTDDFPIEATRQWTERLGSADTQSVETKSRSTESAACLPTCTMEWFPRSVLQEKRRRMGLRSTSMNC